MTGVQELVGQVNAFVWGPVMLIFLVGTGVLLTLRLKGIQLRHLPKGPGLCLRRARGFQR